CRCPPHRRRRLWLPQARDQSVRRAGREPGVSRAKDQDVPGVQYPLLERSRTELLGGQRYGRWQARRIHREARGGSAVESKRIATLCRSPDGIVDQGLAERPDRAGDLMAGGDHVIERPLDPIAVLFGDIQGRQQLDRVTAVTGDLSEDLVVLEQWDRDELAEQALVRRLEHI